MGAGGLHVHGGEPCVGQSVRNRCQGLYTRLHTKNCPYDR